MRERGVFGAVLVMVTLTALDATAAASDAGVLEDVRAVLSTGKLDISDVQKRFFA